MMIPTNLASARYKFSLQRPYLSSAVLSLIPVETKGLGTLGVDKYWRLYYDPKVLDEWSVDELVGVLYHEVGHLIRDHPYRAENLGILHDEQIGYRWNLAADCEINDDLENEKVTLPVMKDEHGKELPTGVFPKSFGLENGLLAEEYFHLLEDKIIENKVEIEIEMDGEEGGSSSSGGKSSSSGSGSGKKIKVKIKAGKPSAANGNCGSCAKGGKAPWELGDPGEKNSDGSTTPGITRSEARMIQQEVAKRIMEEAKSRGNVPAGWKRWAEITLEPKVDWRKELPTQLRTCVAQASGMVDYSYRRPSRRQASYGDVVAPSLYRPLPRLAIGIDTSGSMSDKQVGQALSETHGVLRSAGVSGSSVVVLFADAKVHLVEKVFDVRQMTPLGGGGTDMRVIIEHARTLKPRIDTLLVLTDCLTPWPEEPPKEFKLIIGRLGTGDYPPWAKVIDIDT